MKIAIILATLIPFIAAAAVDAPGSITLIYPDPNKRVPQNTNLTYGFVSSPTQYFGLAQNIQMSHSGPDGNKIPDATFGPPVKTDGYTPSECRSYPGTSSVNEVNATQTGNYTFFFFVTYVESSDSTKANSSYCGPSPFSKQSWSLNSTVAVAEADLGSAVVAATTSTTQNLPSKPTGRVNGAAWVKGSVVNWGSAVGVLAGVGLMV